MRAGDIVFFQSRSFIGRVISKLTKSPYSHVALAVDESNIIEADRFMRTREVALSKVIYPDSKLVIMRPMTSVPQIATAVASARSKVGSKYDYFSVFGWFVSLLTKTKYYGVFNSANRLYCSELIDLSFAEAGVDLVPGEKNGDVLPSHLYTSPMLLRIEEEI